MGDRNPKINNHPWTIIRDIIVYIYISYEEILLILNVPSLYWRFRTDIIIKVCTTILNKLHGQGTSSSSTPY